MSLTSYKRLKLEFYPPQIKKNKSNENLQFLGSIKLFQGVATIASTVRSCLKYVLDVIVIGYFNWLVVYYLSTATEVCETQ